MRGLELANFASDRASDIFEWYGLFWLFRFYPDLEELQPLFCHEVYALNKLYLEACASGSALSQPRLSPIDRVFLTLPSAGRIRSAHALFLNRARSMVQRLFILAEGPEDRHWAVNCTLHKIREFPDLHLAFLKVLSEAALVHRGGPDVLGKLSVIHEPLREVLIAAMENAKAT